MSASTGVGRPLYVYAAQGGVRTLDSGKRSIPVGANNKPRVIIQLPQIMLSREARDPCLNFRWHTSIASLERRLVGNQAEAGVGPLYVH